MKIDLSCPVELWHFKLPTASYPVVSLNLFNLAEKSVTSLQAAILSFDSDDKQYARQVERVSDLGGQPRSAFEVLIAADDGHLASRMDFIIEKVWFEDGTVWRRGAGELSEYKQNRLDASRQLDLLRQLAGADAMGYPSDQGAVWVCLCGRPNAASQTACRRCGREKHEQFTRYNKAAIETLIYKSDTEMEEKAQAARLEAGRMQEEREQKELKRKKRIRNSLLALLILLVLGAGTFATLRFGIPALNYYRAGQALANNQFDEAKERFLALKDWRDSAEMALEADYRKADRFIQNGNVTAIKNAEELFSRLGDYRDSAQRYLSSRYRRAALTLQSGDYAQAADIFESLGTYQDSARRRQDTIYDWAKAQMEALEYEPAREKLLSLQDYRDAAALAEDCLFLPALAHLENKEFVKAEALFKQLPERQAAQLKLQETYYAWGEMLFETKDFEAAAEKFLQAGDYLDAFRRASECLYEPAILLMTQGDYEKALSYFRQILAYRDSAEQAQQAAYQLGLKAMEEEQWQAAADYFISAPDLPEAVAKLQETHYRLAEAALERGENSLAGELYAQAGDYEDAAEKSQKAYYDAGIQLLNQKDYGGAAALFTLIPDYPPAQEELISARYNQAIALLDAGQFEEAAAAFTALGEYSQSADYKNQALYKQAEALLQDGKNEEAAPLFEALGDYLDAAARRREALHAMALVKLNAGDLKGAIDLLKDAREFGNAEELYLSSVYTLAKEEEAAGNYGEAARLYALIPGHEDADAKSEENFNSYFETAYAQAQAGMKNKDYKAVIDALSGLDQSSTGEKYKDIPEIYKEATYRYAEELYTDGKAYEALPYYQSILDYKDVSTRKLTRTSYRIIGQWRTQKGAEFIFREDGTCRIEGKEMFYQAKQYQLLTGTRADELKLQFRIVDLRANSLSLRNNNTSMLYKCERVQE